MTNEVAIIGGGAAALCAALAAYDAGARRIAVYESTPQQGRGGNTRHARNFRIVHEAPSPLFPGHYSAEEFHAELRRVTQGASTPALADMIIRHSSTCPAWLAQHGVQFQTRSSPTLPISRRTAFFLGGGMGVMNQLYRRAASLGIDIHYDSPVAAVRGVLATDDRPAVLVNGVWHETQSLVIASGGDQANRAALRARWGERADHLVVRGIPSCDGTVFANLLAQGMLPVGDPQGGHVVAVDGRSPAFDGGIVTRVLAIPQGIVIDQTGQRFHDEGGDRGPTRYAVWGRLLLDRPQGQGWVLLDRAGWEDAPPSLYPPLIADSWSALARMIGVDPDMVCQTVATYNAACHADGATRGLVPEKSAQARPLVGPPCLAFPMRAGITFSYYGVMVDQNLRLCHASQSTSPRIFVAGMMMAPNLLGRGYLAGAALTISCVSGRLAGQAAAQMAQGDRR